MAKIIAIVNQKGGVAKTTTAHTLGSELARRGFKTLMLDCDPQGTLSAISGVEFEEEKTIFQWLGIGNKVASFEEIVKTVRANLDILPANVILMRAERILITVRNSERILKKKLAEIAKNRYDYIIIDSPAWLGLLWENVVYAADTMIIPTFPEPASVLALKVLFQMVCEFAQDADKELDIAGILFTRVNKSSTAWKQVRDIIQDMVATPYGIPMFKSVIRQSVVASNSAGSGQNIIEFSKGQGVGADYSEFVDELVKYLNN